MPAPRGIGRLRAYIPREILNAIFYILGAGCHWRLLPHYLHRWPTVYYSFRKWRRESNWKYSTGLSVNACEFA
jgi:putative transposase